MAAVRTLSGKADTEVAFGQGGDDVVVLPAIPEMPSEQDIVRVRGAADAAALLLRHHDARLDGVYRPSTRRAAEAYDAMERARVEILGSRRYPGVALNIRRALALRGSGVPELQSLLHSRAGTVPGKTASPSMGKLLDQLLAHIDDQAAFAEIARRVIEVLHLDHPEGEPAAQPTASFLRKSNPAIAAAAQSSDEVSSEHVLARAGERAVSAARSLPSASPYAMAIRMEYRAYTTDYDRVIPARDLCAPEELARLRATLDAGLKDYLPHVSRLVRRLQRRLAARQRSEWEYHLEDGLLDAPRLARIVTNRARPAAFKQKRMGRFTDTAVCLLFDNSGSMQGRPISVAAMTAEILTRTLERCGVTVEVLGFTTADWKGGESRRLWERAGRPQQPGRLNDLRHIVYKAACVPWKRARRHLAAMTSPSILRENVDGEAIAWARRRLRRRHEQRKILVVVSDGAPADESTLSVNPRNYLDRHLHDTAANIQRSGGVELVAIGIGHDVKRFYEKAATISDVEQLAGAMLNEIASLFAERLAVTHCPR